MKQFFTSLLWGIALAVLPTGLNAQVVSFSDDFESYSEGAFLCSSSTAWKTWSNRPGTTEDVRITVERANSGSNSIKFTSASSSGGPVDIVLPFGNKYTTGHFLFSTSLFVENGKAAYFNFQGETTIGRVWALEIAIAANGVLTCRNSSDANLLTTFFPQNEWAELSFDINLTENSWKLLINGECRGAFANPVNAVASLNLYPANASNSFFIDDVSYSYDTLAPVITSDIGISGINWANSKLTGTASTLGFTVRNNGNEIVDEFTAEIFINGTEFIETFAELALEPGTSMTVTTQAVLALQLGANEVDIRVLSVNGTSGDEEACNDKAALLISAVTPADSRAVLVEEATGTWCTWCPRGAVYMDLLSHRYDGHFIPIAVHNNDPMMIAAYDQLITTMPSFSGFPNAVINRRIVIDPSLAEDPFLGEVAVPVIASVSAGAAYDEETRKLDISATIEFLQDVSGEFWVSMALTEDGVRGTGSGWAQVNVYSGGAYGPMGGYELLPNPVPAHLMVYDHVARAILGIQKTAANTISGEFLAGERQVINFSTTIPADQNVENMYLIPILMGAQGYQNAAELTFEDALANGYITSAHDRENPGIQAQILPNPAGSSASLEISLPQPGPVQVIIRDINGFVVAQQHYGWVSGRVMLPAPVQHLGTGIYLAEIRTESGFKTLKLSVVK